MAIVTEVVMQDPSSKRFITVKRDYSDDRLHVITHEKEELDFEISDSESPFKGNWWTATMIAVNLYNKNTLNVTQVELVFDIITKNGMWEQWS